MGFTLHLGDCLDVLKTLSENSVDSLVTDPPAGISFMGKSWDSDKGGGKEWINWLATVGAECLRVMKPGAHGLVWALPKISHRTAIALEWSGFEIRDVVTHLFGSGFPKSLDISKAIDKSARTDRERIRPLGNPAGNGTEGTNALGGSWQKEPWETAPATPATPAAKQWSGWGTALKPAAEFWFLIRKPLSENTVAENVLKWGAGGLNIDGCRIAHNEECRVLKANTQGALDRQMIKQGGRRQDSLELKPSGRFPANLVLDEEAAEMLDEQSGKSKSQRSLIENNGSIWGSGGSVRGHNDSGGASRFFYVAKPSKWERNFGVADIEPTETTDGRQKPIDNPYLRGETKRHNSHPTVKSFGLMRYLITLITPPKGLILDPFLGSGTTGAVSVAMGHPFIGIEKESEYLEIAKKRIGDVKFTDLP